MAQKTQVDDRDETIEPKLYLPVGVTPPFDASRFERLWSTLFNHGVEPPR